MNSFFIWYRAVRARTVCSLAVWSGCMYCLVDDRCLVCARNREKERVRTSECEQNRIAESTHTRSHTWENHCQRSFWTIFVYKQRFANTQTHAEQKLIHIHAGKCVLSHAHHDIW